MSERDAAAPAAEFVPHVLGTAGHIDHGKSTLVERLTGVHPDRLKEEKERGLTIDLGYAPMRLRDGRILGIIDVPGHERFIKNMVAGATSIDVVLLVVAADDGVMPQTREHVDILRLLDVRRGVVALTKIDLVEPDLRDLVQEDLRGILRGTPLETAPIVPLSSTTGEGLDRLREEIERVVATLPQRTAQGAFRMPVQRSFAVQGFGGVVTGVPVSGRIRVGDGMEVLPSGARARVRGLQAYGWPVPEASAGHRLAVNLSEVDWKKLRRGQVIAEPGCFTPATAIEARIDYLRSHSSALRQDLDVRVHLGTSEVVGRLRLLDPKEIPPGGRGYVALLLHEPVVGVPGDRFILRRQSPLETLGGGVLLGSVSGKIRRGPSEGARLEAFERLLGDRPRLVEAWIRRSSGVPREAESVRRTFGLSVEETERTLRELLESGAVRSLGEKGPYLHRESLEHASAEVERAVAKHFGRRSLDAFVDRLALLEATRLPEVVLEAALVEVVAAGRLRSLGHGRYAPSGRQVSLSPRQQELRAALEQAIEAGGMQPPALEEWIAVHSSQNPAEARSIAKLLVEEGRLHRIAEGLYLHASAFERAKKTIAENIRRHGDLEIPKARDALATSRKFLIPLLEHLDAIGFTARRGGKRVLREGGGAAVPRDPGGSR